MKFKTLFFSYKGRDYTINVEQETLHPKLIDKLLEKNISLFPATWDKDNIQISTQKNLDDFIRQLWNVITPIAVNRACL